MRSTSKKETAKMVARESTPLASTPNPISEYGGMETYASKSAMAKHERVEGKKVEKKEQMKYAAAKKKK